MRLQLLTGYHGLATLTCVTCLATAVACSGGSAPSLDGLSDQVAEVGTELKIDLNGTDPDGGNLHYGFHAADLADVDKSAQVTVSPSGAGVFRWTPLAADLGAHAFDFTVSDGDHDTTVTINIDVRSAIGSATAPIFRQPLGTGTTIDLGHQDCVDIAIVVEDQDSANVTIAQEEPLIEGATITDGGDLTGTWHWCPTREQASESRYTVILSANDSDNPKTLKNYLVVLRGQGGSTACPGAAPAIAHTPSNPTTRLDLPVTATVSDDKGLKDAPLFYYSTTPPGSTPDLSTMTQLSTTLASGDKLNGTWTATVPNPVATAPAGTSKTLYYVYVADDDDDPMGSCDHSTTSAVYQMTVTAGGTTVAPLCGACTADAQCGVGNECVIIGNMGASYCVQACGSGCPSGYACSAGTVFSVDGAQANQCIPQSGSCTAPTGTCEDDVYEENDTRSAASANPALGIGIIDAVSCPSTTGTNSDDDWYKIVVAADAMVDLQLLGNGETDVDLHLYHSDGTVVTASTSLDVQEEISTCLPKATYYVKVNAYGHARSTYLLDYESMPAAGGTCTTTCVDDNFDKSPNNDDSFSQARATTYPSFTTTANMICPNDDDWYKIDAPIAGDNLTFDLTFAQSNSMQDLDLHLYQSTASTLTDLWPCSVMDPSTCSSAHGQGAASNEHATYTVPACPNAPCAYYLVVRGYNGSTNSYGLTIAFP